MSLDQIKGAIDAHISAVEQFKNGAEQRINDLENEIVSMKDGAFAGRSLRGGNGVLSELTKSAALQNFIQDRSVKSAGVKLTGMLKTLTKGTVVGDVASSNNQLIHVPAQFDPRLGEGGNRRLSVFELLPTLAVGSNSFEFNRLDGYSNAAAYQSQEGAVKATASMPTELVTSPICTIAHILPVSEQVMADMPALMQQVTVLMTYGVRAKASSEIIAGNVSGKIQGLTTEGTTYTVSGAPSLPDAIASAISQLEINGWQASAILMNPSDWLAVRTMRESVGSGQYLYGSPAQATAQTLWGIPVVVDPAVPLDSPIVMDASQVVILDRQQAMVEFGRTENDFETNTLRARAECRIGLAVFSPSAVLNVAIAS